MTDSYNEFLQLFAPVENQEQYSKKSYEFEFSDESPDFILTETTRTETSTETGIQAVCSESDIYLPLSQIREVIEGLEVCVQEQKEVEFDFVKLTPTDDDGVIFSYEDKSIELDLDKVVYIQEYVKAELGC